MITDCRLARALPGGYPDTTEGPQWMPADGMLLFTNGGSDTTFQLSEGDVSESRVPSNGAVGLAVDSQGRLIATEHEQRRITRTESDGTTTSVADSFEGRMLNAPNDVAVRSDGTVYFTDPTYGMEEGTGELDFAGVFRIAPDGNLTAEWRGDLSATPNGVVLSPDESRLYVSDTVARVVRVFDVAADGLLSEAEEFVTTAGDPDGMAVDAAGILFVTSHRGTSEGGDVVEVFAPDGTPWGVITLPDWPTNAAFGDADGRTLYITGQGAVYLVRLANPGLH